MRLPISTSLSDARRKAAFGVCGRVRHGHRSVEFRRHSTQAETSITTLRILRAADNSWLIDRSEYLLGKRGMILKNPCTAHGVLSERCVDFGEADRIDSSVTRRCAWELLCYERERNGLVPAGCAWRWKLSIHWYISLVMELEAISALFKWDIFASGSDHCKAKRRELQ